MRRFVLLGAIVIVGAVGIAAQQQDKPLTIEKVRENLFMIRGGGGNTAAFIATKGVVLVDTKDPGMGPGIMAQVRSVTDKPVTTIINTHTHGDHTGSNEFFGASVDSVVHENTKANLARMPAFQGEKAQFLPKRTYKDKLTLGAGKDQIDLYHFGPGHTSGDTFIVFTALRTIHMGDMFPWKDAPFIDRSNGGSGRAWPQTLKALLDGVKNVDAVIGGHQPVATWKDLATFQQFTADLYAHAAAAHKAGKPVEAAVADKAWMSKYPGYDSTRLQAAVQAIYDELSGK
jgi:cyclase